MISAKPLPFIVAPKLGQNFKPHKRLPERKYMTLVAALAGARCGVMFADSQETISGYAKKSVDKLAYWGEEEHRKFRFALGGASDNGPYSDMFNSELQGALLTGNPSHIGEACELLEAKALAFHEKHIWPQGDRAPTLETLIMLQWVYTKADGSTGFSHIDLIHIHKTAVLSLTNGVQKSIGVGSYLADYLLEKLQSAAGSTEPYLIATGVYVLQQAKLHIDGVGLNGKLVLFSSNGSIEEYDQIDLDPLEKLMNEFDYVVASSFRDSVSTRELPKSRMFSIAEEFQDIKQRYTKAMAAIPELRRKDLSEFNDKLRKLGA